MVDATNKRSMIRKIQKGIALLLALIVVSLVCVQLGLGLRQTLLTDVNARLQMIYIVTDAVIILGHSLVGWLLWRFRKPLLALIR
jgi:uncharacterized membrane protein AbrB (regulator of aidB expression)